MKKYVTLIAVLIFTICNGFAQENEVSDKQKKKIAKQQHLDSLTQIALDNKPKPDIKYGFALRTGTTWIKGEIPTKPLFKIKPFQKSIPGYHFGAEYDITFERIFTLNFGATYNQAFGQDYLPITGFVSNGDINNAITGSDFYTENYNSEIGTTPNYLNADYLPFMNYKTSFYEMYVNLYYNINITKSFYANLLTGIGYLNYKTKMDLLNANNEIYDFSEITNVENNLDNINIAQQQIADLLDGTYESQAEIYRNDDTSNKTKAVPIYVGFGLTYVLSDNINVAINYKLSLINDNLIDGQQRLRSGLFSDKRDQINAISLKFSFLLKVLESD